MTLEYNGTHYLRIYTETVLSCVFLVSLKSFWNEDGEYMYFYYIRLDSDQGIVKGVLDLPLKDPNINNKKELLNFVHEAWANLKWDIWRKASTLQEVTDHIAYSDDIGALDQIKKSKITKVSPDGSGMSSYCLKGLVSMEDRKDDIIEAIKNYTFYTVS